MNKRVLITGGAGFIAHHLIEHILQVTDWKIVTLDRLDFSGNLNRLSDMMKSFSPETAQRVTVVHHDLRAAINPLVKDRIGHVDYILHLAAGSHVDRSIQYPMEFVLDNVVGTVNLLEFARQVENLQCFMYFSTDEVFGPAPSGISYQERDRYNATNPYSASKAAGEEMCVAFQNTYDLPVVITHTMNVFGKRQHPEKFIPLCIKKILAGDTILIHSDHDRKIPGSRHYLHATDVAQGVLFLLSQQMDFQSSKDFGGAKCPKFNLVGVEEVDNLSLAKTIADCLDQQLHYQLVDFHSSRPGHDLRYAMSGALMANMGWQPNIKFHDGIKQIVDWYRDNPQWLGIG